MAEDSAHAAGESEQPEVFPPVPKRRKAKVKHGHHGGAWKVAYADFITTMMALFLLLWLLSTADQASRVMLSLYFRDPGIFDNPQGQNMVPGSGAAPKTRVAPIMEVAGSGGGGQRNTENTINMEEMTRALHKQLAQTGSDRGAARQASVTASKDGIQIELSDSGERDLFEVGSAVMTRELERMVQDVSRIIGAMNNFTITIAGHTDSRPPPNLKYNNRDLSADRAQRIMQMMVAGGVEQDRFTEVIGYGDTRLLDASSPLSAFNRRVVITLKMTRDFNNRSTVPGGRVLSLPKDDPLGEGFPPLNGGEATEEPGGPAGIEPGIFSPDEPPVAPAGH